MDQDQPLGRIRVDLKFLQTFQKIFRVLGVSVKQGTDDELFFVRLMTAVLAKFLFPDTLDLLLENALLQALRKLSATGPYL